MTGAAGVTAAPCRAHPLRRRLLPLHGLRVLLLAALGFGLSAGQESREDASVESLLGKANDLSQEDEKSMKKELTITDDRSHDQLDKLAQAVAVVGQPTRCAASPLRAARPASTRWLVGSTCR